MAKFEAVPLVELKAGVPGELLNKLRRYVHELRTDQGGKLTLERGETPKEMRRALRAVAASLNQRVHFSRGEGRRTVSFYLEDLPKRRGRKPGRKKRGRLKKRSS